MMKKLIVTSLGSGLSFIATNVMSHSGHGDHSAIYASGQFHPVIGLESLILVSAAVTAIVLAVKFFKR